MVFFDETFGGAQHHVSISNVAEASSAGHYIFTTRLQHGRVGHSDNIHLGLVVWVKRGTFSPKTVISLRL